MSYDLHPHYAAELARLSELRRAFAATHGDAALPDPADDRLLEAIAFLTAGVRARVDDAAADLADALLERLAPGSLRPFPATTVVELAPNRQALRSIQRIPRGRALRARDVDGTRPRFRTTHDVDLTPLHVADAALDLGAAPRLTLTLRATDGGARALAGLDRLRLYLHHPDRELPATLLLWLTRYCAAITLQRGDLPPHPLPPTALHLPAFDPAPRLLPWPATTPPGLALLYEHLVAPDAALFVDLVGLPADEPGPLDLRLTFDFIEPRPGAPPPPRPPPPAALRPGLFRLHCAPAVNLFEVAAEPFVHSPLTGPRRLRPDGLRPDHTELFDVLAAHRSDRAPLLAATDLDPDPVVARYAVLRRPGPDGALDCDLHLTAPAGDLPREVTISARLACTNRDLPRHLSVGDLADDELGPLLRGYTNLTPVTPPLRPERGDLAPWRRLAHRLAAAAALGDVDGLRAFLHLHDLGAARAGEIAARNARCRAAIRGVDRALRHRLDPAGLAPLPVLAVRITFDEPALPSLAAAPLLGAALDRRYADLAPLGCASELTLALHPSGRALTWPLRRASDP